MHWAGAGEQGPFCSEVRAGGTGLPRGQDRELADQETETWGRGDGRRSGEDTAPGAGRPTCRCWRGPPCSAGLARGISVCAASPLLKGEITGVAMWIKEPSHRARHAVSAPAPGSSPFSEGAERVGGQRAPSEGWDQSQLPRSSI